MTPDEALQGLDQLCQNAAALGGMQAQIERVKMAVETATKIFCAEIRECHGVTDEALADAVRRGCAIVDQVFMHYRPPAEPQQEPSGSAMTQAEIEEVLRKQEPK